MKRLYAELAAALAAILAIVCLCAVFSAYAGARIDRAERLLFLTPAPEEFSAAAADERGSEAVLEAVLDLRGETKKAGRILAFFMDYGYMNVLDASVSALEAAVKDGDAGAYGSARAAVFEALESIRRAESFSPELFF